MPINIRNSDREVLILLEKDNIDTDRLIPLGSGSFLVTFLQLLGFLATSQGATTL